MLTTLLINKIHQALEELDHWVDKYAPPSDEHSWYLSVKEHLLQAQKATSIEELECWADIIARMIVDNGPLDKDFMPSFSDLLHKLEKLNK